MIDLEYPFGNPEGSLSNINQMLDSFVNFAHSNFGEGIGLQEKDLSVRVIVGAKGSGKTVYLRRLQAAAKTDDSLYVDDINFNPPETSQIVKFCSYFDETILTEKWMQLWYCAILRSVVSHLLFSKQLRDRIDDSDRLQLTDYVNPLIPFKQPSSPHSSASLILGHFHSEIQYSRFLDLPMWEEIEYILSNLIHSLPPMYLFIDSIDEEFKKAPMYWLRCQKGLFYRVMRLLRHQRLGGRLHITISCRDHVLSSVYRSEHQNRYRGEPHIRILNWNRSAISRLLQEKIRQLPPELLFDAQPTSGSTVGNWIGLNTIRNEVLGIDEDLETYLLRHTRLLPRDVVQLGNRLSRSILFAKASGARAVPMDIVRTVVSDLARTFGNEQLEICANQVLSSTIPVEHRQKAHSTYYTADMEYQGEFVDRIKEVIRLIGVDSFERERLDAIRGQVKAIMEVDTDVFSVLWQNRLLGFRDHRGGRCREVFFDEGFLDEFNLPRFPETFLFHPCLIDSVGITSVVTRPIIPGNYVGDE
jgi:hypothetical protein